MKRVRTDTNVVISALLLPESVPAQALAMVLAEDQLVLTAWIIDEPMRWSSKRPDLVSALNDLLASIDYDQLEASEAGGATIADADDQPILDAAIAAGVDGIVNGDRHFLRLDLNQPSNLTPRQIPGHPPKE